MDEGDGEGGKIILKVKLGGAKGLCTTAHPVGGQAPPKILNFRPSEITSGEFSGHFWFSNDMR